MTPEERTACYALLGLEDGASLAEVKAAHREEVQLLHPDRLEKQPHLKKRATAKLAKVNAAYTALKQTLEADLRERRDALERERQARAQADAERQRRQDQARRARELRQRHQDLLARARALAYPFDAPGLDLADGYAADVLEVFAAHLDIWSEQRHTLEPLLRAAAALGLPSADASVLTPGGRTSLEEHLATSRAASDRLDQLQLEHDALRAQAVASAYPERIGPFQRNLPPTKAQVEASERYLERVRGRLARWTAGRAEAEDLQRQLQALDGDTDLSCVLKTGGLESLRTRVAELEARRLGERRQRQLIAAIAVLGLAGAAAYGFHALSVAQDQEACAAARDAGTVEAWQVYAEQRPDGACQGEADERIEQIPCERAEDRDTVEGWRDFLSRHPDAPCADDARDRIEAIPCEEAAALDSVDGWTRFLQEFPDHRCAERAQRRIDAIPCELASSLDSVEVWTDLLNDHPDARCAEQARRRIPEIPCERARQADTETSWQAYLSAHPSGPCAAEAGDRLHEIRCGTMERFAQVETQPTRWHGLSEHACVLRCEDRCTEDRRVLYTVKDAYDRNQWSIQPGAGLQDTVEQVFGPRLSHPQADDMSPGGTRWAHRPIPYPGLGQPMDACRRAAQLVECD